MERLKKLKLAFFLLLVISAFSYPTSISAQYGMPAPRCDETIDPESYFTKYIDSSDFKAIHPTYNQWQRDQDNYADRSVCINENEKALLMWNFTLPKSLSKYQYSYKYTVALVVNWDKSAQIAHDITPEELIVIAESTPGVTEFLTKYANEPEKSSKFNYFWIGSSSYGESSGYTSPLEINYDIDENDSIAVSENGISWADLNIHYDWINFPTVLIGVKLVENSLPSTGCILDKSPTAVSRYSPKSRKNEQEPEEFIYNSYKIECPGNEYRYSMVNIYSNDGRYTVWLENRKQIASGKISDSDLEKIQRYNNQTSEAIIFSPTPMPKTPIISTTKNNKFSKIKILSIFIFLLLLSTIIFYLLIRYFRKIKNNKTEPETTGSLINSNINQPKPDTPPIKQSKNN